VNDFDKARHQMTSLFFLVVATMKAVFCLVVLVVLASFVFAEGSESLFTTEERAELFRVARGSVPVVNVGPAGPIFSQICSLSSEVRNRNSRNQAAMQHTFAGPWFCNK
jgi:hypothetical protein